MDSVKTAVDIVTGRIPEVFVMDALKELALEAQFRRVERLRAEMLERDAKKRLQAAYDDLENTLQMGDRRGA